MSTGFIADSASSRRIAAALQEAERARRAGHIQESERICRALLKEHPNAAPALNYLALLVRDQGTLDEAAALLTRATEIAPRDAPPHSNLGNLKRRLGDLPGAEQSLRTAIALQPVYPEAHYNLGIVLKEQERAEEALPLFRRAVEQRPRYVEAITQIGVLLRERDETMEALATFDAAIAIDPRYFEARYYRGLLLTALERFDDAIAEIQVALSLSPQHAHAHYALGNALEQSSREEEALTAFGRATELGPDLVEAHRRFNSLAWEMGRKDLNMVSYARSRARIGDHTDMLFAEADQRILQGQAETSEQLLRRAHQLAPERGDITHLLGRALLLQRKFDESIPLLESAKAQEPDAFERHASLGEALLQAGRAHEAAALLEQSVARAPHDQLLLAYLSVAWRETGDSRLDTLTDLSKFIGVYDIEPPRGFSDVESFNRALASDLALLHRRRVEPLDQTLHSGTQTLGDLFDMRAASIEGLRDRIREAIEDYVGRLPYDPSHPLLGRKEDVFDFSGSWSCRLRSSGFHSNHVHPKGWISSAYYVSLPEQVADEKARQGWLKFGESNIALGERDRIERTVKPAVGKLVLFPSYFWHGTVPFASEDVRLTVAFDVVPGKAPSSKPKALAY